MANISTRIEALATESSAHGDMEMVAMCERAAGHVLRDSHTGSVVAPEDIWGETPVVYYVRAICESLTLAAEGECGDVQAMGWTVHAGAEY